MAPSKLATPATTCNELDLKTNIALIQKSESLFQRQLASHSRHDRGVVQGFVATCNTANYVNLHEEIAAQFSEPVITTEDLNSDGEDEPEPMPQPELTGLRCWPH